MDHALLKQRALELWSKGVECHSQGDFRHAVEFYTRSIEAFPTAEAYTFRGWAYSHFGRIEDAIAECKRAIEVDPTLGNPYNDIGAYLIAQDKYDEAIEWLERAKRAPRYEPRHFPYMNLGRVYAAKGMVLKAISELEEALKIEPSEPSCVAALARLRAMIN